MYPLNVIAETQFSIHYHLSHKNTEQNKIEKGKTNKYMMTNNDQHSSSPRSAVSVIGV
jgi:hypothetical protein